MEGATEIRYVGVVLGRGTELRDRTERGGFVGFAEPLPVGTRIVLKGDGPEEAAEVVSVVESSEPARSGMQLRFVAARAAVREPEPAAPVAVASTAVSSAAVEAAAVSSPAVEAAAVSSPTVEAEAVPTLVVGGVGGEGESGSTGGNRRRRRRR
jgi:hypothetical protein